jgi:hypothetical protein
MVLCSSCDSVPLKFKKKNGQSSSLPARIIWAQYRPLLDFAGPLITLNSFLTVSSEGKNAAHESKNGTDAISEEYLDGGGRGTGK